MSNEESIAFIGLGAMGWCIAANLATAAAEGDVASPVTVWNRTSAKAERHAAAFGTRCARTLLDASRADVIITCLPTSAEVAAVVAELAPELKAGSLWIDCTSGDPNTTRETARVLERVGVMMVDSPVSGGPDGAKTGELTAMIGGDANRRAQPVISLFAKKKIVHCGPIGAGHAVKAMNNCLNAAHLIAGGEALIALAKWGVQPDIALAAINASSGRSLQTEVRLPGEVLSRKFNYGFKLGLMLKDVGVAVDGLLSSSNGSKDSIFPVVKRLLEKSSIDEGYDADYTRVVRTLELDAGIVLHETSAASTVS
ncbi:MAG: 3-hydroxyisobutyrate dehydrogenase [Euryarchaeota archaeon]|nr:3-hydroxyisobutyrate dehydrogenase [Euryarchaeota archaeon]|tara:strand:+ start:80 stop:1015 length:936 start_codon:yes stop_codon:yes gene_type:complete